MSDVLAAMDLSELIGYNGGADKRKANMIRVAILTYSGLGVKSISKELSIPVSAVTEMRKSDEFKRICSELSDSAKTAAQTFLHSAVNKAVSVLVEGLESDNERIRITCAKEILDRASISGKQQLEVIQTQSNVSKLTDAELQAILAESSAAPLSLGGGEDE